MNVCIFNGNADPQRSDFEGGLDALCRALEAQGHAVDRIDLRDLDLQRCTGCFGCWIKTPGLCTVKDESTELCRRILAAELLIHCSPLVMGFVSPLLRRANEKLIPDILPYFTIRDRAIHHIGRYSKYPELGLVYLPEPDTDAEDLAIIDAIYHEIAQETGSGYAFMLPLETAAAEVPHALARV